MKYHSTRGGDQLLTFEQTVLSGLAPNGGLYIPQTIPSLPQNWKTNWKELQFHELATEIMSLFIDEDEISRDELKDLVEKSYSKFRTPLITPLTPLTTSSKMLELWHGPTWAFKDVALQFLGNLFEFFLRRRNGDGDGGENGKERERITVVGATSGDTGSAAIHGLRSKKDLSIFILHPKNKVSPIQQAQMTTVLDENVFNLEVEGDFDDCQDIVKSLFSDASFKSKYQLGAVNSINWARILAQITYYFSAYFQSLKQSTSKEEELMDLQFCVPTGNFGDVLAGFYAKRLGLPMRELVIGTNENDILERFWKTGRYEKADSSITATKTTDGGEGAAGGGGGVVKETLSPAMDIMVSSNFERLLWYLVFDDASSLSDVGDAWKVADETVNRWMGELKMEGRFEVGKGVLDRARREFRAERVSDEETRQTILRYFDPSIPEPSTNSSKPPEKPSNSFVVDPHTAVALEAARRVAGTNPPSTTQIILSTAHPAKFSSAVISSLLPTHPNFDFDSTVLPDEFKGLLEKERRVLSVELDDGDGDGDGLKRKRVERLTDVTKRLVEREVERLFGNLEGRGRGSAV